MSPPEWFGHFQHLQACAQNCGQFYLSKITCLQRSLDTITSVPLNPPSRPSPPPGSFRDSEDSVLIFPKYVVYPWVHRTRVTHREKLAAALCILALVTFIETVRKSNSSMAPEGIFTAASQMRMMGASPAHLGGSLSFSLLQCICSIQAFCSPGLGGRSFWTWSIWRKRGSLEMRLNGKEGTVQMMVGKA